MAAEGYDGASGLLPITATAMAAPTERLKPLKILEVRIVDIAGAIALGCPFGNDAELGWHFQKKTHSFSIVMLVL